MADLKPTFIILAAFFLGITVSKRLLFNKTNKFQLPNEVRGYLEVVVETLETSTNEKLVIAQGEPPNHSLELKVCMASLDGSAMILNECQPTSFKDQKDNGWNMFDSSYDVANTYEAVKFPILGETFSTHLVVINAQGSYSIPLPAKMFVDDVMEQLKLEPTGSDTGMEVKATLLLSCTQNNFGNFCSVSCKPPSERHRCDHVTGELKCMGIWIGKNCDINVFITHQEANQFIKRRHKRANSWLRTEEFQAGNIERECQEEVCSREEAREAFEDDELTDQFWSMYIVPNHCSPNPCVLANTERCEDLGTDYTCHCRPGYEGKNCSFEIDLCKSLPCKNGGICNTHSPTSYSCACKPGFRGFDCLINIDECVESNCGPHGTCVDGVNSFSCQCDRGFSGITCEKEINECLSDPCQNGGTCFDFVAYYGCKCPKEFNGMNCEHRISPCSSNPCLNDGTCTLNEDFSFNCLCTPGYTGAQCQHHVKSDCDSSPCSNAATCYEKTNKITNEQVFQCVRPVTYPSPPCNEPIPPCELGENLCPYNATCVSLQQEYLCVCPKGFVGDQCQFRGHDSEAVRRLQCEQDPCLNRARCLHLNNKTSCICRPGFNGTRCENEVNFCASSPCLNNGNCIEAPNGFYCNCPKGYKGSRCEEDMNKCIKNPICLATYKLIYFNCLYVEGETFNDEREV